jgi:serine/threonine protein kinase
VQLESLPGSVLDQKYQIDRQLGKGAMGAVFQATHLGTTRTVAVKVIVPGLAENAEFSQRFKREAEAAGRLRHSNVVNVTDFGVTHAGGRDLAYLVMEYLDGQTLASYLHSEPRPSFDLILDVIDQTARALDAAHAAGIVHRDLKPSNIWLEPNHRGGYHVKVLDFGIAKVGRHAEPGRFSAAAGDNEETVMMTRATMQALETTAGVPDLLATPSSLQTTVGTLLGTPAYMAPEQCQGMPVDGRADIYSLAVIAYEMLCSRLPFQAENFTRLVEMQIHAAPQSPHERDPSLPAALAAVVLNGLDKDPTRRPPSAGAFAARLRAVAEGELALLRRSKDVFHTHSNCFLPLLPLCMSPVLGVLIAMRFFAYRAFEAKLASVEVLTLGLGLICVAMVWFAVQFYKAGCMLVLESASERGRFEPRRGAVLSALAGATPAFVRTQLMSLADPRPASFRDNLLWPIVWAREHSSGRQAIARSRELCAELPGAATALLIRQMVPPVIGLLAMPAMMLLLGATGGALLLVLIEALSGSPAGWMFLMYPLVFTMFYVNSGSAFSFLYWSALRCRGEGGDIALPASTRDSDRSHSSARVRPATLIWLGIPLAMLAIILVRTSTSDSKAAMEEALNEGRGAAVLGYLNAGLPVDQVISDGETALFEAVRQDHRKLADALLARGANVNAHNRRGTTPLMMAAIFGRNQAARTLLDHGAKVNTANNDGRTALMDAAMRGNQPLVQLLLERGANPSLSDIHHKTAQAYASDEGYGEVVSLLSVRTR